VLAGTDVVIVEPRASQELDGSRAGGLHARTLEVLDQRGVVDRFVAEGQLHPIVGFGLSMLAIADQPSRHNHTLGLWQRDIERILAGWVLDDLGAPILRERSVVGLAQDDEGVDVALSDGTMLRARYLVGCDGGRSAVRTAAEIEFPGLDATTSWLLAELELPDEPVLGIRAQGGGIGPVDPTTGTGPYRAVLVEGEVRVREAPTLDDVRAELVRAYGSDFGAHSPTWISRFTDASRQAAAYRSGRVLLAGDAAHIHPPQGGQGLNTGVQDAVNLGWKLAQVVAGTSPDALLDTYHAERHPVGARVQANTKAQVALTTSDERHLALRELLAPLLAADEPRRQIVAMISGLDIAYDLGEGHPLLGRRLPDRDLVTLDGELRAYELLHEARPVLLDLTGAGRFDLGPWSDRVRLVEATSAGPWELPVLGEVAAPPAVLVRPDGHVAWVGEPADPGLEVALTTWFGPAELPRR
jgi:2-polyprenyl-6-methoxyphenol hydroxylase-like FAD-dependent oxidoreductase